MAGKPPKIEQLNGFEFQKETFLLGGSFRHCWYFRPVGSKHWVNYMAPLKTKTLKAELLAFLGDASKAAAYHRASLDRQADVSAAELALRQATAFHARVNSPEWDPGGNTNNPGRVARALNEAAGSAQAILDAERALERSRALRAELDGGSD